MITNLDKVLTGLQIVHTWLSVQKKYDGLPPEFCADAEVYVKRAIDLIKEQDAELKRIKNAEDGLSAIFVERR